jgi:hypothetical protein
LYGAARATERKSGVASTDVCTIAYDLKGVSANAERPASGFGVAVIQFAVAGARGIVDLHLAHWVVCDTAKHLVDAVVD